MYWRKKYQVVLCSKYDREHNFDVILRLAVPCRRLKWACCKHANDVGRQFETPGKWTIIVARQIYFVVRHNFHVALEVTLRHDWKISGYCNTCIFSSTTCEVLRQAAPFFAAFVRYTINIYSIKTYVLLHFEHKNDVTIIIKLHRATRLWLIALLRQ